MGSRQDQKWHLSWSLGEGRGLTNGQREQDEGWRGSGRHSMSLEAGRDLGLYQDLPTSNRKLQLIASGKKSWGGSLLGWPIRWLHDLARDASSFPPLFCHPRLPDFAKACPSMATGGLLQIQVPHVNMTVSSRGRGTIPSQEHLCISKEASPRASGGLSR